MIKKNCVNYALHQNMYIRIIQLTGYLCSFLASLQCTDFHHFFLPKGSWGCPFVLLPPVEAQIKVNIQLSNSHAFQAQVLGTFLFSVRLQSCKMIPRKNKISREAHAKNDCGHICESICKHFNIVCCAKYSLNVLIHENRRTSGCNRRALLWLFQESWSQSTARDQIIGSHSIIIGKSKTCTNQVKIRKDKNQEQTGLMW